MNAHRRRFLVVAGIAVAAVALPFSLPAADTMKIGIIGSGNVGSALGTVWVKAGHEVMFSSRHIEHDQLLKSMVLEGVVGIQSGMAPGALRSRLKVYLGSHGQAAEKK